MENEMTNTVICNDCRVSNPNFFGRYRDFLLSRDTIIAFINAIFLLGGFVVQISGAHEAAQWLYLISAIVGRNPSVPFSR